MTWASVLQEVRRMRFEELYKRRQQRELTMVEAAKMLGVTERAHSKKRPRKPLPGMMLHQDGCAHEWVPGYQRDLIVMLDDATTECYSAFFVEEEGTMSSFRALREVIEGHGLFSSLYADRGSHDWHTEEAGRKVDQTRLTQVGTASHRGRAFSTMTQGSRQARYTTHEVFFKKLHPAKFV